MSVPDERTAVDSRTGRTFQYDPTGRLESKWSQAIDGDDVLSIRIGGRENGTTAPTSQVEGIPNLATSSTDTHIAPSQTFPSNANGQVVVSTAQLIQRDADRRNTMNIDVEESVRPMAQQRVVVAAQPVQQQNGGGLQRLVQQGLHVAPYPLILVLATGQYLDTLLNFAAGVLWHGRQQALRAFAPVALDKRAEMMFSRAGLAHPADGYGALAAELGICGANCTDHSVVSDGDTILDSTKRDLSPVAMRRIWNFRINLVKHLVDRGVSVVVNDVDATWRTDPIKFVIENYFNKADIIASRGRFPMGLGSRVRHHKSTNVVAHLGRWGATVCMGFAVFQATPAVREFLIDGIQISPTVLDDQMWINKELCAQGLRWSRMTKDNGTKIVYEEREQTDYGSLQWSHGRRHPSTHWRCCGSINVNEEGRESCSFETISITSPNISSDPTYKLKVALLPHSIVDRECHFPRIDSPIIEHCHSQKRGMAKKIDSKERGLWWLKDELLHTATEKTEETLFKLYQPKTRLYAPHNNGTTEGYKSKTKAWLSVLQSILAPRFVLAF
jgi:hypothetical protein